MNRVNISICIPAYKNAAFLGRLLNSIAIQTYTDYEVILTDDSPDDEVENFVSGYTGISSLRYFRNPSPLGTPENWNEGIRKATGRWIKIMHDDDWFSGADSLQEFVNIANANPGAAFIYCRYLNVENDHKHSLSSQPSFIRRLLTRRNTASMLSKNIIGPPSVVMHKNDQALFYDPNLKWLVDIDFYIRYIPHAEIRYTGKTLVNIGISEQQVTKTSSRIPQVEIPEHLYVLNKYGAAILNNVAVFDTYWRLIRNFKIKDENDIYKAGYGGKVPAEFLSLVKFQKLVPRTILRVGLASKFLMFARYVPFRLFG